MSEYLDYRADVEDVQFLVNDLAFKMYNQGRTDERAKVLDEVIDILTSDGDYGHETFTLTYLRGLLKSLKEQKNEQM